MSTKNYRVLFERYSESHFIKDFQKKYKKNWLITRSALVKEFARIDQLVLSGRTNPPIHKTIDNRQMIIKHEFAVAGLKQSKKSSGCRVIALVDNEKYTVSVLLVYHKDHLGKKASETAEWERILRVEYKSILSDFSF